jgi:diaminohydroxyphosphoribosylaminopyrimidine deaminase/5-amino-6-(5-phosphoribosylamino)uracil reductase
MTAKRPDALRDAAYMRRALSLARKGWGQTAPNPMVGAVVVRGDAVVGEGWHERWGGPHAEVVALRAAGENARGATVYVTLEPCAHTGKTPPCADALIAAGVQRVVAASRDPTPVAAGGGERLRAAGIAFESGVEEAAARELNAPFFHAARSDRPWVTLKLAVSLDGAITDARRSSAWLTGATARREVHRLRANSDAIAVGIGTALTDDPALTVRGGVQPRVPPRRVVFDNAARLPADSRLARGAREIPTIVVARAPDPRNVEALEGAGVTVIAAADTAAGLRALRALEIRSLLVEGGAGLASSLLEASLVDRLIIFQAPILLGAGALGAFSGLGGRLVADAPRLPVLERRAFGDDVMTVYALDTR